MVWFFLLLLANFLCRASKQNLGKSGSRLNVRELIPTVFPTRKFSSLSSENSEEPEPILEDKRTVKFEANEDTTRSTHKPKTEPIELDGGKSDSQTSGDNSSSSMPSSTPPDKKKGLFRRESTRIFSDLVGAHEHDNLLPKVLHRKTEAPSISMASVSPAEPKQAKEEEIIPVLTPIIPVSSNTTPKTSPKVNPRFDSFEVAKNDSANSESSVTEQKRSHFRGGRAGSISIADLQRAERNIKRVEPSVAVRVRSTSPRKGRSEMASPKDSKEESLGSLSLSASQTKIVITEASEISPKVSPRKPVIKNLIAELKADIEIEEALSPQRKIARKRCHSDNPNDSGPALDEQCRELTKERSLRPGEARANDKRGLSKRTGRSGSTRSGLTTDNLESSRRSNSRSKSPDVSNARKSKTAAPSIDRAARLRNASSRAKSREPDISDLIRSLKNSDEDEQKNVVSADGVKIEAVGNDSAEEEWVRVRNLRRMIRTLKDSKSEEDEQIKTDALTFSLEVLKDFQ